MCILVDCPCRLKKIVRDKTRGSKWGWDKVEVNEALGLYAQFEKAPKDSIKKVSDRLM